MKLIRVKDSKEGGQYALEIFEKVVARGGKTFGLATGSTPVTLYEAMRASDIDFRDCVSVNLDEYVGLGKDHEQSYAYFMQEHLFNAKPFKQSYLPNGLAESLDAEVQRYNALLEENPVDLQLLGIGRNGHIGFNEPGTSFDAVTHVVDLTPSTIEANKRFFADESEVPRQALSMGIKNIMAAKTIVLMAFGSDKADAIAQMFNGPVTTELPASVLQNHPDVYVIVDEAAATKLA